MFMPTYLIFPDCNVVLGIFCKLQLMYRTVDLDQGCPNPVLEGHCPAGFRCFPA